MLDRDDVRTLLPIALAVAGLWLLLKTGIIDAVFLFVFLGMIPGTNYALPAWLVFTTTLIGSVLLINWLRHQPLFIGDLARQEKTARQLARKRVTKKLAIHTPASTTVTPRRKAKRAAS